MNNTHTTAQWVTIMVVSTPRNTLKLSPRKKQTMVVRRGFTLSDVFVNKLATVHRFSSSSPSS